MRLGCLGVVLFGLWVSCANEHVEAPSVSSQVRPVSELNPANTVKTNSVEEPLMASFAKIEAALSVFALRIESTLEVSVPGETPRRVTQQIFIERDRVGNLRATKQTDAEYGWELIWANSQLYSRLRHGRFLQRQESPSKVQELYQKMVGLLPAYLSLLQPYWVTTNATESASSIEGRRVERRIISLARQEKTPTQTEHADVAKAWRQTIVPLTIQGVGDIDSATSVPLNVKLSATWRFVPPTEDVPNSGIPTTFDQTKSGTMKLEMTQTVERIGAVTEINAPPIEQIATDTKRLRLEIERQILTGERPVPDRWKPRALSR